MHHFNTPLHYDSRLLIIVCISRVGEQKREWQDAISSGFDRLVAYATEVDRRRKSTDSNSPKRARSGSISPQQPQQQSCSEVDRASTLSMKFKGSLQRSSKSPAGENQHPKKRYFAESTSKASSRSGLPCAASTFYEEDEGDIEEGHDFTRRQKNA